MPGGSHKARYANNKSILIDDSLRNIDLFAKAGGYGILHISSVNTIKQIKNIRNWNATRSSIKLDNGYPH